MKIRYKKSTKVIARIVWKGDINLKKEKKCWTNSLVKWIPVMILVVNQIVVAHISSVVFAKGVSAQQDQEVTNIPQNSQVPVETVSPGGIEFTPTPAPINTPVVSTQSPVGTIPPVDIQNTSWPDENPGTSDSTQEMLCRITYKLNGGTNHVSNPDSVKKSGAMVTLLSPSRKGYAFAGWYKESTFQTRVTTVGNTKENSITLYAKWKKITVRRTVISSVKRVSASKIRVTVKKYSGVKGYEIVYAKSASFAKKSIVRTTLNPKNLSRVKSDNVYYIKVRSYKKDSCGNKIYGPYSKVYKYKKR